MRYVNPGQYQPSGYINVSRARSFYLYPKPVVITKEEKINLITDMTNVAIYENLYGRDICGLIKDYVLNCVGKKEKVILNNIVQIADQSPDKILELHDAEITDYIRNIKSGKLTGHITTDTDASSNTYFNTQLIHSLNHLH